MGGGQINVPEGDYLVTAKAYKNGQSRHSQITLEVEITPPAGEGDKWLFKFEQIQTMQSAQALLKWLNNPVAGSTQRPPESNMVNEKQVYEEVVGALLTSLQQYDTFILPTWATCPGSSAPILAASTVSTGLVTGKEKDTRCCSIM